MIPEEDSIVQGIHCRYRLVGDQTNVVQVGVVQFPEEADIQRDRED